jgi:signal transduction histidine kinase
VVRPKENLPSEHVVVHNQRRAPRRTVDLRVINGNKELETALLISQALSRHCTLEELIVQTLDTALEAIGAASGSIFLSDAASQQLINYRSVGDKPLPPGSAVPWNHGIAGAVFKSAQHAIIVDAEKDPSLPERIDKSTGSVIKNLVIVPLKRWQGEPIGVIEVLNKRNQQIDDDDVAVLTMISSLATPAIEEARLFEAKKLAEVAQMAGDMSHDIKNLLMPVLCGAELLKEELEELSEKWSIRKTPQSEKSRALCHEVLTMVEEDVRRISDRVRELADCVKGMTSPPRFAQCRIASVVEAVLKTLDLMAKRKGVALISKGLDALPVIEADEQRLYNAFYNLVNNAISETPSGGAITIFGEAAQTADVLDITVTDTGRGMPPEIRDSLFTARAISRKTGGTGLGTKIVKEVVDAHKGHINVESTIGVGTTFRLILPLRQVKSGKS